MNCRSKVGWRACELLQRAHSPQPRQDGISAVLRQAAGNVQYLQIATKTVIVDSVWLLVSYHEEVIALNLNDPNDLSHGFVKVDRVSSS